MPTYVTWKDLKKRWGSSQEDVFPVTQLEKLWSDMTRLDELDCCFLLVDRPRGQQLKAQAHSTPGSGMDRQLMWMSYTSGGELLPIRFGRTLSRRRGS